MGWGEVVDEISSPYITLYHVYSLPFSVVNIFISSSPAGLFCCPFFLFFVIFFLAISLDVIHIHI